MAVMVMQTTGAMAKFHRHDSAVDNQCRPETRAEPQEEHGASPVGPERLERRVVERLHRSTESGLKVETDPSLCQVVRFGLRMPVANNARIPDRDDVIFPAPGEPLDARDHLARRQSFSGRELPPLGLTAGKDLYVRPADIDYEDLWRCFHPDSLHRHG
jgi:hypothetical protein